MDETIAELFSRYTSPDYKEGDVEKPLAEIATKLIEGDAMQKVDKVTQDEINPISNKPTAKASEDAREQLVHCSFTCGDKGPTPYGYWDTATGKWEAKNRDDLFLKVIDALKNRSFESIDSFGIE